MASSTQTQPTYKPMYLAGWFLFDSASASFRNARKIELETYSTREDAWMLAAIYNRAYARACTCGAPIDNTRCEAHA